MNLASTWHGAIGRVTASCKRISRAATLLAMGSLALALKLHYARAEVDELRWILAPTAYLADWMSGAHFVYESGSGYLSHERLFLIEKPCAGINFLVAAMVMSAMVIARQPSMAKVALAFGVSYIMAILANALRIAVALLLATHRIAGPQVHRLEGVIVYFGALLGLYVFLEYGVFSRPRPHVRPSPNSNPRADAAPRPSTHPAPRWRGLLVPIAAYELVALILPFINGASILLEHAAVVALVPLAMVFAMRASVRWGRG